GPIAYRTGSAGGRRELVWFDRMGNENGKLMGPESAGSEPGISRDGRNLAFLRTTNSKTDVWLMELARGMAMRLTFDDGNKYSPVWSPDGSTVVFQSDRHGVFDLYKKSATGAGSEELLLTTPQNKSPMDWSPDGRYILYRTVDSAGSYDLWAVPVAGDG